MAISKITNDGIGDINELTVDTNTLVVDSTNNRVGIGTTSPSQVLEITNGTSPAYVVQTRGDLQTILGPTGSLVTSAGQVGTITNSPFRFTTNNIERMRLLASGGLTFNGDTAAANALDDYEEGTFTLTLDDVDNTGLTVYSAQYVKVGNMVTVSFYILFPTTTDNSTISIQLPFQAVSLSNGWQAGTIGYNTSGNEDQGTIINNATNNLQIRNKANGSTRNYASYSGDAIIASITYRTA